MATILGCARLSVSKVLLGLLSLPGSCALMSLMTNPLGEFSDAIGSEINSYDQGIANQAGTANPAVDVSVGAHHVTVLCVKPVLQQMWWVTSDHFATGNRAEDWVTAI